MLFSYRDKEVFQLDRSLTLIALDCWLRLEVWCGVSNWAAPVVVMLDIGCKWEWARGQRFGGERRWEAGFHESDS